MRTRLVQLAILGLLVLLCYFGPELGRLTFRAIDAMFYREHVWTPAELKTIAEKDAFKQSVKRALNRRYNR